LGQVGGGPVDHSLPALEGLLLPIEPILEDGKLLHPEAQFLFMAANLFIHRGKPSLLQAQVFRSGVGALLASMEQGLPVLGLLQPLPGV
jgi:hypothetical protein